MVEHALIQNQHLQQRIKQIKCRNILFKLDIRAHSYFDSYFGFQFNVFTRLYVGRGRTCTVHERQLDLYPN